jgi:hypothetical protein
MVDIALDKSTDAATAITDNSHKVNIYIDREMVLETSTQFCMINVCRETEKERSVYE